MPVRDEEEHVEHLWLTVQRLDDERIHGQLDNEPVDVKSVRLGSKLTVSREEVTDWIVVDGGRMVGGFTAKVLENLND